MRECCASASLPTAACWVTRTLRSGRRARPQSLAALYVRTSRTPALTVVVLHKRSTGCSLYPARAPYLPLCSPRQHLFRQGHRPHAVRQTYRQPFPSDSSRSRSIAILAGYQADVFLCELNPRRGTACSCSPHGCFPRWRREGTAGAVQPAWLSFLRFRSLRRSVRTTPGASSYVESASRTRSHDCRRPRLAGSREA